MWLIKFGFVVLEHCILYPLALLTYKLGFDKMYKIIVKRGNTIEPRLHSYLAERKTV